MKTYSLQAVEKYINQLGDYEIVEIPGSLLDTYIINHGFAVEVIEAKYLNSWSSTYVRHIYRKRIPQRLIKWIDQEISELENSGQNIVENDELYNLYTAMVVFQNFNGGRRENTIQGMVE